LDERPVRLLTGETPGPQDSWPVQRPAGTPAAMKIALVSQKGGVGKSSLAVSIAWELVARGSSVLIVDGDPQGTARIASEVATEGGRRAPTAVALGKDMCRPEHLRRMQSFDHVVIDTPAKLGDVQRAALMIADVALVPISQSGAEVWGNTDTIALISQAQMINTTLKGALVFVRKLPNTALGKRARAIFEGNDFPLLVSETTFRVAWQEAITAGVGVAQYAPKDKAARELRCVVDEVLAFAAGQGSEEEVVNG
jgi:chromosome partitioning protein